MVQFIESELVLLKKEIDEMWTLVYNQLGRAGEAVLTLDRELAQQVLVRERRVNAFELKIDSDIEDIIALYNPVAIDLRACHAQNQYEPGAFGRFRRRHSPLCVELQGTDSGKRTGEGTAPGGDDKSSFGYACTCQKSSSGRKSGTGNRGIRQR